MKCAGSDCNKKLKNGNQKYCSNSCKQKAAYIRKKKEPVVESVGVTIRGVHYEKFVLEYAVDIENRKIRP